MPYLDQLEYKGTLYDLQDSNLKEELASYEDIFTGDVDESVRNWLDEHPEATTTVQDNSITTAKIVDEAVTETKISSGLNNTLAKKSEFVLGANKPEMECVFAEMAHTETDESDNVTYYGLYKLAGADYYQTYIALQGSCYNSSNQHFILSITDSAFINAILIEIDSSFDVVKRSQPLPLGHANGLAYNSQTNKICVATGNTGENAQNIVLIDADDLTVDSTQSMGHVSWFIAYDPDNDIYYEIDHSGNLNKLSSSFQQLSSVPMNLQYYGDGSIGGNGLFVYDEHCYYIGYIRDALDQEYTGLFINTFNDAGNVQSLGRYTLSANTDESESVSVVGNIGYVFSGQTWFRVYKLYLDVDGIIEPKSEYFGRGDRIPENANLNNYTIPGKYNCASSSIASTLSNAPYSYSGFTLYVTSETWLNLRHEIIYATGDKYERIYENSAWSNWKKVIEINQVTTSTKTVSVTNSSSTTVDTINIPVGKIAFVSSIVEFPSNSTGRRMLSIDNNWCSAVNAVSSDSTRLNGSMIIDNRDGSSTRYVNIRAYQSSGSSLSVTSKTTYVII